MSENNKRQIHVYLFPAYVTIGSIEARAKPIYDFFEKKSIELVPKYWDGSIEGLPNNRSLVRASSQMYCTRDEFFNACESKGHVGFYECQSLSEEQKQLLEQLINGQETQEHQNMFIGGDELERGFSVYRLPNTPIPLLKKAVSSAEVSSKPILEALYTLTELVKEKETVHKVSDNETE